MASLMDHLFTIPETMERFIFPTTPNHSDNHRGGGAAAEASAHIHADVLDCPKEYVFYLDVPGLSKSDIQVTVEDENTLVIKSTAKRKREEVDGGVGEGEGCKYIRLEWRSPQKLMRRFRLPENANVSAISAKCENGVLRVVVKKHPPPPKPKSFQVAIS
ncbi:unnamed protein product [Linum tenue]|uniref:SHSP domain-containing protein n=1 Tax=Linum tenue TaxID=586396 RepID=A0AAV0NUW2_9ROSI|nr:unnamed protein product [Linum tenue]